MDAHKVDHVLNSFPPNDGETAADYRDRMNTVSEEIRNSTAYSWSGLCDRLERDGLLPAQIIAFASMLPTIPGGDVLDKMLQSSGGADLSRASIQTALSAVETDEQSAPIIAAVKAVGVRDVTPWQFMSTVVGSSPASLNDAEQVLTAQNKRSLSSLLDERRILIREAIDAGTVTTVEEMNSLFAEE